VEHVPGGRQSTAIALLSLLAAAIALTASSRAVATVTPLAWEQWHPDPAVVDVAGPLSSGDLVVAAGPHLYRVGRDGTQSELSPQYAAPPFAPPSGAEAYIVAVPSDPTGAWFGFKTDTVFAIRPASPSAVIRIDPGGKPSIFETLPQAGSLNGIALDTAGRFGHRLLVSGSLPGGHTAVVELDADGNQSTLTTTAPVFEGGLTVAPLPLPGFGGDLIAPDELSGHVLAIDPSGAATLVANSSAPSGPDTGVEGAAFVPSGFLTSGSAYTADRATPNNPHPGTDTLLRLQGAAFAAAGVREGDLLLTTEASDRIVDIRCVPDCSAQTIGMGQSVAHGEGHLLLVAGSAVTTHTPPASSAPVPAAADGGGVPLVPVALAAAAVALALGWLGGRWFRRRRPSSDA
jgi:hypothetical protein